MADPATGQTLTYNITSSVVLKTIPGRLLKIFVIAKGSTSGSSHDSNTLGGATIANQICFIADSGIMDIQVPFLSGLVIKVGTGAIYSVLWS